MSDFDLRSACERALTLAAEKHRVDVLLTKTRNRIDEALKAQYKSTGVVGKFKLRKLGEVRLDGADPEPKAIVTDADAYSSWVAERFPDEAVATIEVPVGDLENALAGLALSGVDVVKSTVTVRDAFQTSHLKSLELHDHPDWTEGSDVRRWIPVDAESGEVVDGVGGRLPNQVLKLILARDLKAEIEDGAETEDAQVVLDSVTDGEAS